MYTQALAFASLPLLAQCTPVDIPSSHDKRDSAPSTSEVKWSNPTGGNLQLGFADQGLQFGTTKPSDIIRNNVSSICSTVGTCVGGNDVTMPKAQYIDSGDLEDLDISFTVDGDYPQWVHNGLIDMLAWAYDNQTQTNNVCYSPYATSSCNFESYCPQPQQSCQDQYTAPGSIAVVLAGDDAPSDAAPGYISVQFTIQKDGDSGLCGNLFKIGSGVAGFIGEAGGPAGGIFSLASLFCNLPS